MLVTMCRVGQSRGDIDQGLSQVRRVLAEASNLETPSGFLKALEKVKARENKTLNLEQVHASVDFSPFFVQLDVNISGHSPATTEWGEEAAYVFVFQERKHWPASCLQALKFAQTSGILERLFADGRWLQAQLPGSMPSKFMDHDQQWRHFLACLFQGWGDTEESQNFEVTSIKNCCSRKTATKSKRDLSNWRSSETNAILSNPCILQGPLELKAKKGACSYIDQFHPSLCFGLLTIWDGPPSWWRLFRMEEIRHVPVDMAFVVPWFAGFHTC